MLNDLDAEVDVMDQDDLTKLSMEHKSLKKGLEDIQDTYNKGTMAASTARGGSGSTSDWDDVGDLPHTDLDKVGNRFQPLGSTAFRF
jgi:hypothetical protein